MGAGRSIRSSRVLLEQHVGDIRQQAHEPPHQLLCLPVSAAHAAGPVPKSLGRNEEVAVNIVALSDSLIRDDEMVKAPGPNDPAPPRYSAAETHAPVLERA